MKQFSKSAKIWSNIIFWSWNVIFLTFLFTVVIPEMGSNIIEAFFNGEISLDFFIILIFACTIPIISVILALTKFRGNPGKITQLFYGIEVPLILILFCRLWLFKELTPGIWQILIVFVFAVAVYFFDLLKEKIPSKKINDLILFTGHSLLCILAVYIGIILLFYFIPAISQLVISFFEFEWTKIFRELKYADTFYRIFMFFIGVLFVTFSATVLLLFPILMPYLFIKKFISSFKTFKIKYDKNKVIGVFSAVLVINISLFFILNIQPQEKLMKKLRKFEEAGEFTTTEKLEIIKNREQYRKGLLNAHLSAYRYVSSTETNNHIEEIYEEVFGTGEKTSGYIQSAYNSLMTPFFYKGGRDSYEAEKFYEYIFDKPIQRAEQKAIKHAMESTWERDRVEADLLDLNDEKVYITNQEINIKEKEGTAEIEIYETYKNMTQNEQEIFYYFNLPESAVITGLWLSDDETDKKYEFNVSPRGAAQQVYKDIVARRRDPSLLEQTGPGMYRLRAFPIPVEPNKLNENEQNNSSNTKFRLWLKYVCTEKGSSYPLPKLSEKRNVYWNKKTIFKFNNTEIDKEKNWLPENIPAKTKFNQNIVSLDNSTVFKLENIKQTSNIKITGNTAILIDPTYSMNYVKQSLDNTIRELRTKNINADVFTLSENSFTKTKLSNFKTEELLLFGSFSYYSLLSNFLTKTNLNNYENIIFITDEGSYELGDNSEKESLNFTKPLYFLHLENKFPQSYDDRVLDNIETSGGGIAGNVEDLLLKISLNENEEKKQFIPDLYSKKIWKIDSISDTIEENKNPFIKKIAAKLYIDLLVKKSQKLSLDKLDKIHFLAKKHGIVTPYSSMIVLVEDWQKEALTEAETKEDRFEREVETGKEFTSSSGGIFSVSGTPEPEEWILLSIISFVLIFLVYKKYLR